VAERLVEAGVPRAQITIARDNAVLSVGQAAVTVTPALHDWQEVNPWQRGDCCGYLIRTPDGAIWHPGDTRLIDELRAFNGVDVLFFDVAAVDSHLGPAGSAELAKSCGASVLLAYHYGTFDMPPGTFATCDPEDALPYLEGLRVRYLRVNPGELLDLPVG
jgi:L-ascorbate metabolism protein UlaG (beta-lactamase superfamily)